MENLSEASGVKQKIIKGAKLNLLTFLMIVPFLLVSVIPYAWLYGYQDTYFEIKSLITPQFILLLMLGIILHEGLHALTWIILLKKGLKCIKFGFNVHSFSPYTHCKIPMKAWQYKLGGLVPGLVMGVGPIFVSFFVNNTILNFVGFLFLWAASGDIISLFLIRKLPDNSMVMDHPEEMGFIILNNNEQAQEKSK